MITMETVCFCVGLAVGVVTATIILVAEALVEDYRRQKLKGGTK